jgi:hypothetical protein
MSLSEKGRIIIDKDETGKITKCIIYVPIYVARDSKFPFSETTDIQVTISGTRIISETVFEI